MNRRITEIATQFLGGETSISSHRPAATAEDIKELKHAARLLRNELDRVIEDEVAGNQACEAATDNVGRLRSLAADRRHELEALRRKADEAHADCLQVQQAYKDEEDRMNDLRENAVIFQNDIRRAASEALKIRGQTKQIKYTLETAVPDTIFRLRADVQNIQTDCEIKEIHLRDLRSQMKIIRQSLDSKRQEIDAIECRATNQQKELEEARKQYDLNHTRYISLADQLQGMGGKVPRDNLVTSVQHLFTKMTTKESTRKNEFSNSQNCIPEADDHHHQQQQLLSPESIPNLRDSQQQTHTSFTTTDHFFNLPRQYQIGVPSNENQQKGNVYLQQGHQGMSIHCKDDDTIVSSLTVDEKEF